MTLQISKVSFVSILTQVVTEYFCARVPLFRRNRDTPFIACYLRIYSLNAESNPYTPCIDLQFAGSVGMMLILYALCTVIMCHLQFKEQIWKPDIFRLVALLTGFHPERTGQICLSTSDSPGDKEIPVFCHISISNDSIEKKCDGFTGTYAGT